MMLSLSFGGSKAAARSTTFSQKCSRRSRLLRVRGTAGNPRSLPALSYSCGERTGLVGRKLTDSQRCLTVDCNGTFIGAGVLAPQVSALRGDPFGVAPNNFKEE